MQIYSNSSPKDIVRNAFYKNIQGVTEVSIASPFFSYSELVEDLLKSGCFGDKVSGRVLENAH